MTKREKVNEIWRKILMGELKETWPGRHLFGLLPSNPRCRFCNAPFKGIGAPIARLVFRKQPSRLNPTFCNVCDRFVSQHLGGAEIELTMLFADVRGSTTIAEEMNPIDFTRMMNRFYATAMNVLVKTDAWIDKMIGDEIIGLYLPAFAGRDHARRAIEAGQELLKVTGHLRSEGPWLPVGVGIHTGVAFMGSVGSEKGVIHVTVLGDSVNTTARLVSKARIGEIVVSEHACQSAGLASERYNRRLLKLKGRRKPVAVRVLNAHSKLQ